MDKPTPPELGGRLPLLGHAWAFRRDPVALLRRGLDELGPLFSIRLGPKRAAVLLGPANHREFFAHTDTRLSMNKAYRFLAAMFGEVGFAASPKVYMEQRPILHAPFKTSKMPAYVAAMRREVQAWLDSLPMEGEVEVTSALTRVVMRVAGRAFMGERFNDTVGPEFWDRYVDLSRGIDPILPPNLPLPRFLRRDRARERLRAILSPMVAERRRDPDAHDDFMRELVLMTYADGRQVETETIVNILIALLFAGHETTVGQAAWTVAELLRAPTYRALVEAELTAEIPDGVELDAAAVGRLAHVERAIKEVERMHPSAHILLRVVDEELDLGTHRVPAGWLAIVSPAVAHRMADLFRDPDRFDPARFGPDRAEDKQDRFAMIGFGGGLHRCTGMNFAIAEMTVITALMFRQLEMRLVGPAPTTLYSMGAPRPDEVRVAYRRRERRARRTA